MFNHPYLTIMTFKWKMPSDWDIFIFHWRKLLERLWIERYMTQRIAYFENSLFNVRMVLRIQRFMKKWLKEVKKRKIIAIKSSYLSLKRKLKIKY